MDTPRLAPALYPIALLACSAAPPSATRPAPCSPSPIASPAAAQPPGRPHGAAPPPPFALIQNVSGRKVRSLNGAWRTIVDPYENGYYDYRRQPRTQDGYFANRKPSSKSALIEHDFDRSETLAVPAEQGGRHALAEGLISDRGKKKQAFFVLQRFYERLAQSAASKRGPNGKSHAPSG